MKTEAEMRMRQPQAEKFPEPPEAAGGKKGSSPGEFGGILSLLTP